MSAELRPIADVDIPAVCVFLKTSFQSSLPLSRWELLFTRFGGDCKPNNGFMLISNGEIVGVAGATYCRRVLQNQSVELFCNLTSWTVLPEFREDAIRLLFAVVRQSGMSITCMTPIGAATRVLERFKFNRLDGAKGMFVNRPSFGMAWNAADAAEHFTGRDRQIIEQHRDLPGVGLLGVDHDGKSALIVFIRGRHRKLPCARILYASDWAVAEQAWPALAGTLLLRYGLVLSMVETRRTAEWRRRPPFTISGSPILYRSDAAGDDDIDGLFGELVILTPLPSVASSIRHRLGIGDRVGGIASGAG